MIGRVNTVEMINLTIGLEFKPGDRRMGIKKWWDEIIKKLTKKCHVCGHENPKDAKKCSNCGADISDVK